MTYSEMRQKQSLPYEAKIAHAEKRAWEYYDRVLGEGHNAHVSVGGLDSITLFLFLHSIGIHVHGVSASSLEAKSIQRIHKALKIENIKPYMRQTDVLNDLGFPVISKAKASKINNLQKQDNPKQTFIHAIMTGDMGEQGNFEHSDKIKLPDKWLKLFGGMYQEHRPDLVCQSADFKVSAQCCKYMKEAPCDDWAKEHDSFPYLGLMASEGGQREHGLTKNGCNYFGKTTTRSAPFAIFMRQDILQLALDMDKYYQAHWQEFSDIHLDTIIPEAYGEIVRDEDGMLRTTKAQRTGCTMCGFGIHLEKRPHRFDRLYEENPKEWDFWMNRCCTDKLTGKPYGWGHVLDYIGIRWTPETLAADIAAQDEKERKKREAAERKKARMAQTKLVGA